MESKERGTIVKMLKPGMIRSTCDSVALQEALSPVSVTPKFVSGVYACGR